MILKKSLSEIILSFTDAVLGLKKAGLYLSEARLGISKKIKAGLASQRLGYTSQWLNLDLKDWIYPFKG